MKSVERGDQGKWIGCLLQRYQFSPKIPVLNVVILKTHSFGKQIQIERERRIEELSIIESPLPIVAYLGAGPRQT